MRAATTFMFVLLATRGVSAQSPIVPSQVAPRVAQPRIERAAMREREIVTALAAPATADPQRVELARERAEAEQSLAADLSLARSAGVNLDAAARVAWEHTAGRGLETIDAAQRWRDCLEVVRRTHVRSDAARTCRDHADDAHALPEALFIAGYTAAFAEDHAGAVSAALYRQAVEDLSRRPADRALRLGVAAMQLLTHDAEAAVRTLGPLPPNEYEPRLDRALAEYALGHTDVARESLVALFRAAPERPEVAFDLAQLELPRESSAFARVEPALARRALAAYRVQLCSPDRTVPASPEIAEIAARRANALQAVIERPSNWSADRSVRPVVPRDRLPSSMRALWPDDLPPMTNCDAARARALALLDPTVVSVGPRRVHSQELAAIAPPVSALVGPRPRFAWNEDGEATVDVCDDSACTHVSASHRASGRNATFPMSIASGLHFWRVTLGRRVTTPRAFWVAAHARGVFRVSDVNCDGWPDVPLDNSGWYARFDASGSPRLLPIPGDETSTAHTFFAGDLDGDGCGDFAQITGEGLQVLYGSPSGPEPPQHIDADWVTWAESLGDVDGNGREDLFVWSSEVARVLLFDERGAPPRSVALPGLSRHPQSIGDVNGDGRVDSALFDSDYSRVTAWWEIHLGDGAALATSSSGRVPSSYTVADRIVGIGDVNGDGRGDVAAWSPQASEGDPPGRFDLYLGTARGIAAHASGHVDAPDPYVVVLPLGDIDGDGRDDTLWRERDRVLLRSGFDGAAQDIGPWTRDVSVIPARMPDAEPAVVWLFRPLSGTALRVEAGRAREIRLRPDR